jgi:hypothetical protein
MSDPTSGTNNEPSSAAEGDSAARAGGPAELGGSGPPPPPPPPPRPPYPWVRLLYAIGFSFVAWAVFWIILLLALAHYITIAITGRANEELRMMSLRAIHYLKELLGFITGAMDEKPFPLGPFPRD